MSNRYARDELIRIGLDMASVPNLKYHDCPDGVVLDSAYSIQWLQDIIDFWYHMVPFSSGVQFVELNIPALTSSIAVPGDFILDVRDGYIVQTTPDVSSKKRMQRLPLQKWITCDLSCQGKPASHSIYYMIQGNNIRVSPMSSSIQRAWLWYYFLPASLRSTDKPPFLSDYVLIEYIRIRALEWCGHFPPGTAQKFCDNIVSQMRSSGLMNEAENDDIPVADSRSYASSRYSWMGAV